MPSPESRRERVTWVLLPKEVDHDGPELVFSVYVGPALTADSSDGQPSLADFPDWLDWPATLAQVRFAVELTFEGQGSVTTEARLHPEDRSSDLWHLLFPADTSVSPFEHPDDLTGRPVLTFAAAEVMETLRRSYGQAVLEAVDDLPLIAPPPATALAEAQPRPFDDVFRAVRDPANNFLLTGDASVFASGMTTLIASARSSVDASAMVEVLPGGGGAAAEIGRAMAFHRGSAGASTPRTGDVGAPAAPGRQAVDFHAILASLSEHPALLRRLGLVFDLAIPVGSITPAEGLATLVPTWQPRLPGPTASDGGAALPVDKPLVVSWRLDPGASMPFAATSDGPPGIVDIGSQSDYHVEPVALDSAALQAVAMVTGMDDEGRRTAPPALRNPGLMLVHDGHAQAVHAELAAATVDGHGTRLDVPMLGDDLVRGYRLDVFDEDRGAWFSLHQRSVDYLREGGSLFGPVLDEGAFHPSVTGPFVEPGQEPQAEPPMHIHEGFLQWDGWSLSAPRPGRTLSNTTDPEDLARPDTLTERPANDPLTSTGLQIRADVRPGTLPRLRFGRSYRLRLRTVDLAGNGLSLEEANELWSGQLLQGGRDGRAARSPGDYSTDAVTFARYEPVPPPAIVKANPEPGSAHRLVVRSDVDADLFGRLETTDSDELQLFAPRASIELVERHGLLDDVIGSGDPATVQAGFDLASRESGVLPHQGAAAIPYLPDPLAIGVAIADAPGMPPGITFLHRWRSSTWHDPLPVTLRLVVNDEAFQPAPDLDDERRIITVKLDAARRHRIRIASMLPTVPGSDEPPTELGLVAWAAERSVDEQHLNQVKRAVATSRHAMFTPWQEVELVHAVQRPQQAPGLQKESEIIRHPGQTQLRTTASLVPEPFSTATLTLTAGWTDFVDDPNVSMPASREGEPLPWTRQVSTVVGSTSLAEPELVDGVEPELERTDLYSAGSTMPLLELGDTKYRTVGFTATATSRFAEYFPDELAQQPGRLTRTGESVDYIALSTGRPPAPVVLDVVPLVRRREEVVDGHLERVSEGGWLRIWLARPWFVTGEEERLGLLVGKDAPEGPNRNWYDLVSLLGADAARPSTTTTVGLRAEDLLNAVQVESVEVQELVDVSPEGALELQVAVVDPKFDAEQQRWYADLHLDAKGIYFPFVRLALVRYQFHSVPGEGAGEARERYAVSPVVLTEPVPLMPERRLLFLTPADDPGSPLADFQSVGATVTGPTYVLPAAGQAGPLPQGAATMTARCQRRTHLPVTGTEDDWTTVRTFDFARLDGTWGLTAALSELADVDRILVVEEDYVPYDPAVPQPTALAPRVVYAEVIPGPFASVPG